ncbi:MAG: nickel pincer cofactor biosynthesis protein LarC [Acidobacteria bacterium]|nr:nickel pincer cofactor biosynthesis protein LarC [Acidobacteriota bacterium]
MRIAYLDCFSGISGDMFLGALVDAGVSARLLEETVAALQVGAKLEISRVDRSGITATKVDVIVNGEKDQPREHKHEHGHGHHHHEHDGHQHSSRAGAPAPHSHDHQHGRGLKQIKQLIAQAAISPRAKQTATAIFEALGAAESKIHNVDIQKIHFHEVGAVDAIVDIVCAAVGAEALGVDEIVCSPLNVGGGTVKCAHGTFPVPAPATVELLSDAPIFSSGVQAELVTPTGAAIVKTLAGRFAAFPAMKVEKAGYGAGSRDLPGAANVVRLTVGEALPSEVALPPAEQDAVAVLEANLDDLNPQIVGYVMERLLAAGALDVFAAPVQMKKNRPGTLLTVLSQPDDAARLTEILFAETTTLGVRQREEKRQVLAREWATVATEWGDVRIKIARRKGTVTNYAPEYEDCRKIAEEKQIPLKAVMQAAIQRYLKDL